MSKETLKLTIESLVRLALDEVLPQIEEALKQEQDEPVAYCEIHHLPEPCVQCKKEHEGYNTKPQPSQKQEQGEPVAWWDPKLGVFDEKHFDQLQPLYTKPQPSQKPLTDEQYFEIGQRHWLPSNKIEQIHKEIAEAAHGIKE